MSMTYAGTGVNYDAMDPFKRVAQALAKSTAPYIHRLGFKEVEASRGESAYLVEHKDRYFAHVEEGLGTKNLVADAMYDIAKRKGLFPKSYYDQLAECTVAMIVNDMITCGALPISVAMHLAVAESEWFQDDNRVSDLMLGWKEACRHSGAVWGGGETPTLKGVVVPGTVLLSGSAFGVIEQKKFFIKGDVVPGDAIVIIESSGIHANGLTLARKIAEKLPDGYLTKLSDGRSYGETLLDATRIYAVLVEWCQREDVHIHYAVNITGHGWRKLMRLAQNLTYVIETLPTQLPVFSFIQEHGPVDDLEAYGNLNMGAGFALYLAEQDTEKVLAAAKRLGFRAFVAGHVEAGERKVLIKPKGIEFLGNTLGVR